jgi:methionyl-tRNA formyltransferase
MDFVTVTTDKNATLPMTVVDFSSRDIAESKPEDIMIGETIRLADFDLLLSLHCRQKLPDSVLKAVRCVNVHPGYLPFGRGWRPVAFALANRTPAGASLHVMTSDIDAGPIIASQRVPYDHGTSCEELYQKVRVAEQNLVLDNLKRVASGHYGVLHQPDTLRPLNTKKDYEDLCNLGELSRDSPELRLIDRLNGLTYGSQHNAYFTTAGGDKYRVGLKIEKVETENDEA